MHGLIFVTWEKYIAERFGTPLFQSYRTTIGETVATAPLANRVYEDAALIAGVQALCKLSGVPANTLLREYGRYFIINGLTSHLCAYFLTRVHNARELLLVMREGHQQMRRMPEGLTPPLFNYESIANDPQGLVLIYDSPRKLCSVLLGAIEGAAERYGEQVHIIERTCMKRGASACRFEVHFRPIAQYNSDYKNSRQPERLKQQRERQHLADLILSLLPAQNGFTMNELQSQLLTLPGMQLESLRPRIIFEALRHLQYAGLITSTANQPGDILTQRRYWRVPTHDAISAHNPTTPQPAYPLIAQTSSRGRDKRTSYITTPIASLQQKTPVTSVQKDAHMPPDMLGHANHKEKPRHKTGSLLIQYRQQHSISPS